MSEREREALEAAERAAIAALPWYTQRRNGLWKIDAEDLDAACRAYAAVLVGTTREPSEERDMLEAAWGIIANAGGGNWDLETPEWREAAVKWREQYHAALSGVPAVGESPLANLGVPDHLLRSDMSATEYEVRRRAQALGESPPPREPDDERRNSPYGPTWGASRQAAKYYEDMRQGDPVRPPHNIMYHALEMAYRIDSVSGSALSPEAVDLIRREVLALRPFVDTFTCREEYDDTVQMILQRLDALADVSLETVERVAWETLKIRREMAGKVPKNDDADVVDCVLSVFRRLSGSEP
jgi:hypothetical protein